MEAKRIGAGNAYNGVEDAFRTGFNGESMNAGMINEEAKTAEQNGLTPRSYGGLQGIEKATSNITTWKTAGHGNMSIGVVDTGKVEGINKGSKAAQLSIGEKKLIDTLEKANAYDVAKKEVFFNRAAQALHLPDNLQGVIKLASLTGGRIENIVLNKQEAERLFGKDAPAGLYSISVADNGKITQLVAKNGRDVFMVNSDGSVTHYDMTNDGKMAYWDQKSGYVYQDGKLTVKGSGKTTPAYAVGYGWIGKELDQLNKQFNAGIPAGWIHALKGVSGSFTMEGKTIHLQGVATGDGEHELGEFLKNHGLTKPGNLLIDASKDHKAAQVDIVFGPKGLAANVAVGNKEVAESISKSIKDTQDVSKYGTNVDIGNGINPYLNPHVSEQELEKQLAKPNMAGFMRTNNETVFVAGAMGFFDKVLDVVHTNYSGKSGLGNSVRDQKMGKVNLALSTPGILSKFSPVSGGATLSKIHTKESMSSQDAGYSTTVDTLREKFRSEAIQIYNATKGINDVNERATIRRELLASSAEKLLSAGSLAEKEGYKGSLDGVNPDTPVLKADNSDEPMPQTNPVNDTEELTKLLEEQYENNKNWQDRTGEGK